MNVVTNSEVRYWLDSLGCLQPCPICGKSGQRAVHFNVAHHECWMSSVHRHAELCELYDKLQTKQRYGL